ncbi:MAG: substrate-binding domain-containing protein [Pirellulales bacterium]|nr:substrate-binding domain-containing protein [Pirellulales bacterium]
MKSPIDRILILLQQYSAGTKDALAGALEFWRASNQSLVRWECSDDCSFEELRRWQPQGVIAIIQRGRTDRAFATLDCPLVSLSCQPLRGNWPQLVFDQATLGRAAATHLLGQGHRRFVCVFNSRDEKQKERADGFTQLLKKESISKIWSCQMTGSSLFEDGRPCTGESSAVDLLELPQPIGVFAATDHLGFQLCELARRQQRRIPDDFSIVAVGDHRGISELSLPTLSTVEIPWRQLGMEVAQLLHRHLQQSSLAAQVVTVAPQVEMRIRQSTDSYAVTDADLVTALAYIRQNLHRSITVADVARKASLSRRVLELRFLEHLRQTPMEFIRLLRLETSRKLLSDQRKSIAQIAQQCGFSSSTHFGVAFRRQYTITPSEFRLRMRSGSDVNAERLSTIADDESPTNGEMLRQNWP